MSDRGTETAIDTDVDARNYVESLLSDPDQPLVFFALEWCEFCWSVRKLFKAIEVPYHSVDLDSVKYQENDLGGRIRAVLKERNGVTTIPQIFIAGQRVGGATDTFDAWNSGQLQKLLQDAGVSFKSPPDFNPFELLPGWLHSR